MSGQGRGRGRSRKTAVPVRGGWDVLPHGLGTTQGEGPTLQSPEETPTTMATSSQSLQSQSTTQGVTGPTETTSQPATQPATRATRATTRAATRAMTLSTQPLTTAKATTTTKSSSSTTTLTPTIPSKTLETTEKPSSQLLAKAGEVTTPSVAINSGPNTSATGQLTVGGSKKRKQHTPNNLLNSKESEPTAEGGAEPEPETGLRRSKRIKALAPNPDAAQESKAAPPPQKQHIRNETTSSGNATEQDPKPKKEKRKAKKTKDNPYGLMPGETPFPEWAAPSAAQCEEVYRLLADMHDDVKPQAPEVIPAPSLDVAGCGEVPSVLDALLRTLLSGATTFDNADKMIKGLVNKFGILEDGIGKGSIDWNKARLSSIEDVIDAIRVGGLGNNKAKSIKSILDMVYQEMVERRDAYLQERKTGVEASVVGASVKTKGQKDLEILKVEKNILSLDHIRDLSVDEAMKEFTKYPGVGVKTSACVILFCLQRPCFAVDTHVDKFSRWLRWVPEKATIDDVFSHLEVRCPDHLKYGLHQLFIRHGKTCGKCRRHTVEGTEEWKTLVCPLEHLLDRFDKRQSKAKPKPSTKKKKVDAEEDELDGDGGGDMKEEDTPVKDEDADGLDGIEGGIAVTAEAATLGVRRGDNDNGDMTSMEADAEKGEAGDEAEAEAEADDGGMEPEGSS